MGHHPRITEILVQKRRPKRRFIFINGEFICGVDREVVTTLGLRVGQEVNRGEIQKVLRHEELNRARDYALKLLSYRPRTVKEVQDRLKKRGYDEGIVDKIIKKLERLSLLNDREFAMNWAASRMRSKPVGKLRLRQELLLKGISEDLIRETIETAYQEVDELELAIRVAGQKMRSCKSLDDMTARRRVYSFLQRRGFSYETIKEVLEKPMGKIREEE